MTNTERKLDEAQYFLKMLNVEDPYFDYILSAYLNAARSITWIMRHEFHNIEGWEEWFKSQMINKEQKSLLNTINDLRIASTKQNGVKTDYYLLEKLLIDEKDYSKVKEILDEDGLYKFTLVAADEINIEEQNENKTIIGCTVINENDSSNSRNELYNLCKDYYEFLEIQVNNCIKRFT